VKYSENRTVWVDLSDAGKRLMVRVRDRGIGIPMPEQKEIFRKFVRGAASKTASGIAAPPGGMFPCSAAGEPCIVGGAPGGGIPPIGGIGGACGICVAGGG
jgi:hypothetical protein